MAFKDGFVGPTSLHGEAGKGGVRRPEDKQHGNYDEGFLRTFPVRSPVRAGTFMRCKTCETIVPVGGHDCQPGGRR